LSLQFCNKPPPPTLSHNRTIPLDSHRCHRNLSEGTAELAILSRPFGTWHTRLPVSAIPPGWRYWNPSGIGHSCPLGAYVSSKMPTACRPSHVAGLSSVLCARSLCLRPGLDYWTGWRI